MKKKLLYFFSGCLLGGAAVCLPMQILSLLFAGKPMAPGSILTAYLFISAALSLFLAVSGVSLIRHEGFRPRNLAGIAPGAVWIMGSLLCLALLRFAPGRILSLSASLLGCYFDYLLSGILLTGFLAARHKPAYDKDYVIIPLHRSPLPVGTLPQDFVCDQNGTVAKWTFPSLRGAPTGPWQSVISC